MSVSGPLFAPTRDAVIDHAISDIVQTVGSETVRTVQARLDQVLVNPTGYYRSRITLGKFSRDRADVHDSNVIYGPVLERGRRGSRFRGYHTFRLATAEVQQKVDRFVAGEIGELVRRLS